MTARRPRARWVAAVIASALIAVACGFAEPPSGWVFPEPHPVPEGATALAIEVAPVPTDIPDDAGFGCPVALLSPVELVVDRSVRPGAVGYRVAATGQPIRLQWSWGVSAYELDGVVRIVSPTGVALMTEGQVAEGLGGGGGEDPNSFSVCIDTSLPQRFGGEPVQ